MYKVSRTSDFVVLDIEGLGVIHLTPRKAKKIAKQLLHFAADVFQYADPVDGIFSEIKK